MSQEELAQQIAQGIQLQSQRPGVADSMETQSLRRLEEAGVFKAPTASRLKTSEHSLHDAFGDYANPTAAHMCSQAAKRNKEGFKNREEAIRAEQIRGIMPQDRARAIPTSNESHRPPDHRATNDPPIPPSHHGLLEYAKIQQNMRLNLKQSYAFFLVVSACLKRMANPGSYKARRMLVTGVGGTGKTWVITAIKRWFEAMSLI